MKPARRENLLALIFFAVMTVFYLHPLELVMTTHMHNTGDSLQMVEIMDWLEHAMFTPGVTTMGINMFWPMTDAMKYIDSAYGFLPGFIPLHLLTGNDILTYNILYIVAYIVSGWGMYLLMRRWTGSIAAAIVAGMIFAFIPHKHPMHLFTHAIFWLPIILLGLEKILKQVKPSKWLILGTSTAIALMCLSSWYVAYMGVWPIIIYCLFFARTKEDWKRLVIVGALSIVMILPFLWPYFGAVKDFHWDITGVELYSVSIEKFANPLSTFFIGFIPLTLLILSVKKYWRVKHYRYLAVVLLFGLILTLGPRLRYHDTLMPVILPYRLLYEFVPMTSGLRAVGRNFLLIMFAVSCLGAYGFTVLEAWSNKRFTQGTLKKFGTAIVATLVLILFILETFQIPLRVYARGKIDNLPTYNPYYSAAIDGRKVYEKLAEYPVEQPVVEVPFFEGVWWRNTRYLYASTLHWHPLVNGTGKGNPPFTAEVHQSMCKLPSAETLEFLAGHGVYYLVFHPQYYRDTLSEKFSCDAGDPDEILKKLMADTEHVEFIMSDGDAHLFALKNVVPGVPGETPTP